MRTKITTEASYAFKNRETYKNSNTKVWESMKGVFMSLHDNRIAHRVGNVIRLDNCGWDTQTTKERLNGILEVYFGKRYKIFKKNGIWFLKDEETIKQWSNGMKFTIN